MNKTNKEIVKAVLKTGIKRTVLALLTTATFAGAILGFIKTASATGYVAVMLFLASIAVTLFGFATLYAQGFMYEEDQGDGK